MSSRGLHPVGRRAQKTDRAASPLDVARHRHHAVPADDLGLWRRTRRQRPDSSSVSEVSSATAIRFSVSIRGSAWSWIQACTVDRVTPILSAR